MKQIIYIITLVLLVITGVNAQNDTKLKLPRFWEEKDGYLLFTPTEEITGDLHKNNYDKIVFGKNRIDANGNAQQLCSSFNLHDHIYGRVFMRTSILNYKVYMPELSNEAAKNTSGSFFVKLFINGALQPYSLMSASLVDAGLEASPTFTLIVNGEGDDAQLNNELFFEALNKLSAGQHLIKLEVWGVQGQFVTVEPIATGEFTLNKAVGSSIGLGRTFDDVVAGMTDPELEARIMKKLNTYAKANGWDETFTRIRITSEDWNILRNTLTGVVTGRSLQITALATWPDGHCTIQDFSVRQDHDGTSFQTSLQVEGIGEQEKVDCN